MLSAGGILSIIHVLPLIVIFAIVGLELSIAFLQAYVFTVLLCNFGMQLRISGLVSCREIL